MGRTVAETFHVTAIPISGKNADTNVSLAVCTCTESLSANNDYFYVRAVVAVLGDAE